MDTQFSLRDSLLAVTLISVGAATWPLTTRYFRVAHFDALLFLAIGGAFAGAGVGAIFHKKTLGVVLGFYAGVLTATFLVVLAKF